LNVSLVDQADIINAMKNTLDEDAKIIANLNLKLDEEQVLIDDLNTYNRRTTAIK